MTREEMIDEAVRRTLLAIFTGFDNGTWRPDPDECDEFNLHWKALHAQPREPNGRFRKKK